MRQTDGSKFCLVPVGRLPRLSRSMHFGGEVSEARGERLARTT